MEEIKIKREAYVKRIKELEQEESAASSDEERKRITRKRRYVENKLYHLSLPVERRDYKVKIRFVFEGEAKVYATSKEEAKQIVKDSFGMRCGEMVIGLSTAYSILRTTGHTQAGNAFLASSQRVIYLLFSHVRPTTRTGQIRCSALWRSGSL